MKLYYMWIQNYGTIQNQGFSFGGPTLFEYEPLTKRLLHRPNPNYIMDFFQYKNEKTSVSNITAIIGENGAGKSTLLKYIRKHVVGGFGAPNAITIVHGRQVPICYFDLEISNQKELEENGVLEFRPCRPMPSSNSLPNRRQWHEFEGIYYSPVFDATIDEPELLIRNISTNYLTQVDSLSAFRLEEVRRQVIFLIENQGRALPFQPPSEIELKLADRHKLDLKLSFPKFQRTLSKIHDELTIASYNSNSKTTFLCNAYKSVLNGFFIGAFQMSVLTQEMNKMSIPYRSLSGPDIFAKVRDLLLKIDQSTHFEFGRGAIKILETLSETADTFELTPDHAGLKITSLQALETINQIYSKFSLRINLNYEWRNLSSGENAILNMFSRFYYTVSHLFGDNDCTFYSTPLLILIDEGELFLHPQWQKHWLHTLIEFLSQLYAGKQLHIILTSNSPFLVSDLPKSHVIFLAKKGDLITVVDGLEEKKQTFAANIHSLLSDSFFMREGLIGEFAKRKINELAHLILDGDIEELENNSEELERLITMIGEPVIRNKLISILNDRLAINLLSLRKRLTALEKKVGL